MKTIKKKKGMIKLISRFVRGVKKRYSILAHGPMRIAVDLGGKV